MPKDQTKHFPTDREEEPLDPINPQAASRPYILAYSLALGVLACDRGLTSGWAQSSQESNQVTACTKACSLAQRSCFLLVSQRTVKPCTTPLYRLIW